MNSRTIEVMLVEDSVVVRNRLRTLVNESGCAQVTGETGSVEGALRLLPMLRPDFVVLDLQLEDGSGSAVLTNIKTNLPGCVVSVLTMFEMPEFRDRCLELGADYFFSKASEFEKVIDALRGIASSRFAG